MQNKVLVENKRYKQLKRFTALLFLFAVLFAVVLTVVGVINSRNLNGEVTEVTGELTSVEKESDNYILQLGDKKYNANPLESHSEMLESLKGQTVTLVIPKSQVSNDRPWVLGVKQGDEIVIDYQEIIAAKLRDNKIVMIIFGVLIGVFVLSSGVVYTWQKKTSPVSEKELAPSYCEYALLRQPSCPAYRKSWIALLVYFVISIVCVVTVSLVGKFVSQSAVQISVIICMAFLFVCATVFFAVYFAYILPKKEREFYAKNYPFDFNDISHVMLRKKVKAQLQTELTAERETFPHRYGDGGNGYLLDFTEKGVSLSIEDSEEMAPAANNVFGEGGDAPTTSHHVLDLTYQQLNLEAVPYYRNKDRSLFVIVKSRLDDSENLPEDMINDIHIILDTNLLATLRHFNVTVENLDYILENKEQLIRENCKRKRRKQNLTNE